VATSREPPWKFDAYRLAHRLTELWRTEDDAVTLMIRIVPILHWAKAELAESALIEGSSPDDPGLREFHERLDAALDVSRAILSGGTDPELGRSWGKAISELSSWLQGLLLAPGPPGSEGLQ
jgi:hypothetical protein